MIILILVFLGLCLGSFITALNWRILEQSKISSKLTSPRLSIVYGRSMCPNCEHQLKATDLIPVLSWVLLAGKCRYCHKSISIRYPLAELTTGLLFVLSYLLWPFRFHTEGIVLFSVWLAILVILIALTIYDIERKLLPNRLVLILVILVLIQIIIKAIYSKGAISVIDGPIFGVLCSAGIFYLLYMISNGKWIGGGDVKLSIGLGLLVGGPSEAILMVFLSSLLGSLVSIPFLILGKLNTSSKIPFGPFLIVSAIICYFFGMDIITWYKHTLLI